jgi:hypothetical protein
VFGANLFLLVAKMVDYKKFDTIIDSDEDNSDCDGKDNAVSAMASVKALTGLTTTSAAAPNCPPAPPKALPMTKKGREGRFKFEFGGRTIYEWEQNLAEVILYIEPPPGVTKSMFDIEISNHHLKIGIKNAPPYIDEETGGLVKTSESMWMLSDGELVVNLQKMKKAEAWDCALVGQQGQAVDPHTKEEIKKKLMLERFQEEVRKTWSADTLC